MAGRLLSPLEGLFSLPEPGRVPVVIQMSDHRVSATTPACAALSPRTEGATLPFRTDMDKASRSSTAGLGCVRGTSFALLFEAGAALLVYGIFQLWHLFR
jgi:hypothetical protein